MRSGEVGSGCGEEIRVGRTGLAYLAFRPWQDDRVQGTTLRRSADGGDGALDLRRDAPRMGGTSPGWRRFLREWGREARLVVGMEQVHGIRVRVVDPPPGGAGGSAGGPRILRSCDGLVTSSPGVLLTATVADCVPVFLRDDATGAIGLLHAGWRGAAGGILAAGIAAMGRSFGTAAKDITLYMGPAIAGPCYPVGPDVLQRFSRWIDPPRAALFPASRLDLRAILGGQALELGIRRARVFRSAFCTHCRTDLFYSHRGEGGRSGRFAAFFGIPAVDSP